MDCRDVKVNKRELNWKTVKLRGEEGSKVKAKWIEVKGSKVPEEK